MNIAFLSSYNGSSAHAITDACLEGDIIASPTLLITNNPNANALNWAKNKGLKTSILNNQQYPNAADLDFEIANTLQKHKISLVILSGYMKLIGPKTLSAANNRMLNIHPALLPKYGGQGMFGSNVHRAVIENKETETGITIHQVNAKYDEGRIIAQRKIPVLPNDTAHDIEEKVKAAEPEFYIETIRKIQKGEIDL